ncbi:MAG: tetratricopeptide repeat protein [Nitrospinales bacterium]
MRSMCKIFFIVFLLALANPAQSNQDLFKKAMKADKVGFFDDAVVQWKDYLATNPETDYRIFAQIKLSLTYLKLEKPKEALDTAKDLQSSAPENFHANFNAGNVLAGFMNYTDAAKAFESVIRLNPERGLGYVGLALCKFGDREPEKAMELLHKAKKVFKKIRNISWHRDARIMIGQIRAFDKYPPNFSDLWLANSLKNVRDTYEKKILRKYRKSLTQ